MLIRNRDSLLSQGNIAARRDVLDILETGLAAGDPYERMRQCLRIVNNKLIVGTEKMLPLGIIGGQGLERPRPFPNEPLVFDLDQINHIYVVGGGKAAQRQAQAIEDVLGDRITEGHVNAKKGDAVYLKRCSVTLGGHPIPDDDSVIGAQRIIEIERKARKGDIVFMSESGGGSALMTLPAPGLTLQDLQDVNRILYIEHGAPMPVANAVRGILVTLRLKHSRHVGEATLIQFSTDERPDDMRVTILHAPFTPKEAYANAINLLHEYDCWDEIPQAVRDFLERADPAYGPLRPEEWWDKPHFRFRVIGPETMIEAAKQRALSLGLDARVLVTSLASLDAATIGQTAAYIAQEIEAHDQPFAAPSVLLLGGELVVPTGKVHGSGGRNQEFALAAAPRIAGSERIVIASADSDGSDGPTAFAGGIVDGQTMARATQMGLDVAHALRYHDSCGLLSALGDAIDTGVLTTNVQDLRVIYVGQKA